MDKIIRRLNIRQLSAFCAVMEHGSISEAARILCISQPAVTKSIRLFEEELRIELFKRAGGRLYPSFEAQRLYPTAKKVFEIIAETAAVAQRLRNGQAGRLVIAAGFTLAAKFIPEAIREFHQRRPLVDASWRCRLSR